MPVTLAQAKTKKDVVDRLIDSTDFSSLDGCWVWQGYAPPEKKGRTGGSYGRIWHDKGSRLVHRVAYESLVGPVPDGMQLDHLCRVRLCWNPDHLEPVTCKENVRRGVLGAVSGAREQAKTHCPYGHPYDDKNTHIDRHGHRTCKACWPRRKAKAKANRTGGAE